MALWQRLPADRELHLLFLGTEPDCISQPPLHLGVALAAQEPVEQRGKKSATPGPGLQNPPGAVVCALPLPAGQHRVPVTQGGACHGAKGVPAPELLPGGGLADGWAHLFGTLHKQGVNTGGV